MRQWIALAAALYPQPWRERYGEEFDALLEDHNPGWREFTDVLRGALKMQMTNATSYLKLAGGLAIAGAIVATGVSFSLPGRYQSTAVMRMTPQQIPETALEKAQPHFGFQLGDIEQLIMSRTSLEGIITSPNLDLYKEERARMPMENIVQQMRQRDLRIYALNQPADSPHGILAFAISFSYPDRQKAQAVVRELVTKFTETNVVVQRNHVRLWQAIWPQSTPPPGENLEVIDPPRAPAKPISPNRVSYAAVGLASGLMLGLIAAVAIRRPKWTLQMAGFAVGCCALAFAVSLLFPKTYTSSAVMRVTPAMVPERLTGDTKVTPRAERLDQLEAQVLSDASLEEIVRSEDLYSRERAGSPVASVLGRMRQDLSIQRLHPLHGAPDDASAFAISFSYPDASKAQAVVRRVVTAFAERNVIAARARAKASADPKVIQIEEYRLGENLEVVDPPSDPQAPIAPNRLAVSLAGLALGLVLGALTLYFRRPRSPALRTA